MTATDERELEDACLILWAELPVNETVRLAAEFPQLADFLAHLHHSIEHEQAMVRGNVWVDRAMRDNGSSPTS